MGPIGLPELIVISVIVLLSCGVPVAAVLLVLYLMRRKNAGATTPPPPGSPH